MYGTCFNLVLKCMKPSKGWWTTVSGLVGRNSFFHPELIQESRTRMKILLLDPTRPIPVRTITTILQEAITIYTSGKVRIR